MRVHLPHGAFLGNIDQFLQGFDPREPDKLEITAVDKWIWLHPVALSMIAALSIGLKKENIICQTITAKSGHYFERIGLFKFLGIDSGMNILEHDPSGRFIPLTQIKNSDDLTKFITEMIPMLHLESRQAEPIRYIVSELVRNVLEHAETNQGAILCAQYFKKSNTIRIGIVDIGIGIRKSINRSHFTSDDVDAIKLSLIPGVTGTTKREGGTAQNAGAGLFFIKSIAYTNHNFFVIYSGTGMYKLLRKKETGKLILNADPFLDRHSERNDLPRWQGTVVGIDISLDSTSEFITLLDLIRDTYSRAVRERKEQRYRKQANFI
jgi:anti-sigma regulatory factor (Ser/Thr protein kinase)